MCELCREGRVEYNNKILVVYLVLSNESGLPQGTRRYHLDIKSRKEREGNRDSLKIFAKSSQCHWVFFARCPLKDCFGDLVVLCIVRPVAALVLHLAGGDPPHAIVLDLPEILGLFGVYEIPVFCFSCYIFPGRLLISAVLLRVCVCVCVCLSVGL